MEYSEVLQQFEKIEQKVDNLIQVCTSLEAEKLNLAQENERLIRKLQAKDQEQERFVSEKDMIRTRIDNLLVKLKDVTEVK